MHNLEIFWILKQFYKVSFLLIGVNGHFQLQRYDYLVSNTREYNFQ